MVILSGCSLWRPEIPTHKAGEDIQSLPAVVPEQTGMDAREKAAGEFRQRACRFLENSKPDDAIHLLERAISLDPREGRNYYYLSSAWMMKRNKIQADEFNKLAEMYLGETEEWNRKIEDQRKRIETMK